jgi:hypothetical protein
VDDADTGVSEVFALITSLLDPDVYPAEEIARLYCARWRVETLFKILKVGIRESHAVFRSCGPATATCPDVTVSDATGRYAGMKLTSAIGAGRADDRP